MGQANYSLERNGTDLSKIGGSAMGSGGMTTSVHFMQVVPNSHFWTDLNQIIISIDYYFDWMERKIYPEPNVYLGDNEMSKEYLLIGLNNSKKNGYRIKRFDESKLKHIPTHFKSIDQIIDYVEAHDFEI